MGLPNCPKSSVDIRNCPNCSQSAPDCTKSIMDRPVSTKTPIGTSNSTQSPMGPSYRPRSSATPLRISIAPTGDTRRSSMVSPNVGKTSGGTQCSRDVLSRVTPSKRKSSCMSQQDSDLSPFHVDTPDTPYGQVFGVTPTRSMAKCWKKYLDNFGTYVKEESPPVTPRRYITPISKLQMYEIFFKPGDFEGLHTNSGDGQNEANVSLPKVKKMQSQTTVTETMASSSIGTPEDRVAQHLQKLDRELASHTPPETTLKRHHDLNVIQPPGYTSTNLSYSKQIHKSGLIDSQPITIDWEDPIETAARAKTMASSSIGTPEDRVAQHLQKLDRELASHTPPETTLKRHHDLNVIQPPGYTSTNLSYSKQIHKSGLIDSQPITIDWEDPIETAARAKI